MSGRVGWSALFDVLRRDGEVLLSPQSAASAFRRAAERSGIETVMVRVPDGSGWAVRAVEGKAD